MSVTSYYSFGGEILGEETGSVRRDYLTDALGSVTATVTSAGAIENTYCYKPYGEQLSKTGTGTDPKFLWNGSTGSRRSGIKWSENYNRHRHYGLKQALWTTVDGIWPDQPAYLYVKGMVVSYTDPSGFACEMKITGTNNNMKCKAECDDFMKCHRCVFDFRYHLRIKLLHKDCGKCSLYQWYSDNNGKWRRDNAAGWPIPGQILHPDQDIFDDYPGDSGNPTFFSFGSECGDLSYKSSFKTCLCCAGGSKCITWTISSEAKKCKGPKCDSTGPTLVSVGESASSCEKARKGLI